MGSSDSNLKKQIIHYYIFHKKIERFFENGYNPFFKNEKKELNIERFYVIDRYLVQTWKQYCNYIMFKTYFDEIKFKSNLKKYKEELEKKFDETNKELKLENLYWEKNLNNTGELIWFSKSILELRHFNNIIDEESYKYFKNNLKFRKKSEIKGIITDTKIVLFFENNFKMKFLYFGNLADPNGEEKKELIQLTADFTNNENNSFNQKYFIETYNQFKNTICYNIENAFSLFEKHNIRYLSEEKIIFSVKYEHKNYSYSFYLKNENLSAKFLDKNYRTINYQRLNSNNLRLIGLANVGATCYMNATLQCFFNVPELTKYLLKNNIYSKIIQNNKIFELSSAYCDLLYHVCCDENVKGYYEPKNFKNVISWKNPLFKGVNANDSKDLVNFMLEEMNQELINLEPTQDNNINNNNIHMDQTDKYSMLNLFKSDFSKNNNSIIAKNFFFITQTKTRCSNCNIFKYNYQTLYLLEFPLEVVFKYCLNNNKKCVDNNGKKCICLKYCFEHYRFPTEFTGDNQLFCNSCSQLTNSYNQSSLYSLPKTLIIILNRGRGKIFDCIVDFPNELDLDKYVLCPQSITKYKLSGVITHLGDSGMSGHFIAFCRHRLDNNWYRYNDAIVTLCQDQNNEYKIGTPYILFYEAIDNKSNVLFDGKFADTNSFVHKNNFNSNNFNMNNMNMINNMSNNNMIINSMNNNNMMININNNNLNPKTDNLISKNNKFRRMNTAPLCFNNYNNFNMNQMNNNMNFTNNNFNNPMNLNSGNMNNFYGNFNNFNNNNTPNFMPFNMNNCNMNINNCNMNMNMNNF